MHQHTQYKHNTHTTHNYGQIEAEMKARGDRFEESCEAEGKIRLGEAGWKVRGAASTQTKRPLCRTPLQTLACACIAHSAHPI